MTLEQIDFFLMAVRCDTFLEAAENLHIAQSTLSKQIQKLETELNLPLFDRTRRQAVLTPAGELFLQEAAELSLQYHQMLQKAAPRWLSSVSDAVSSHFPHPCLHARASGN